MHIPSEIKKKKDDAYMIILTVFIFSLLVQNQTNQTFGMV